MKVDRREVFRTIASLGAAMMLAAFIRYSIQETLSLTTKILLIAGAVCLVAGLAFNFRAILGFFSKRSSKLGTNVAVMALAVLVILSLANFLGYRHHKRFDLTSEKLYSLSDQTQRIVRGLKDDVKVILFERTPDPDLGDRMLEYTNLNRRLRYETVDPEEHPEIARQYGVSRRGQIIVARGPRTERLEGTTEQDITNALLKVTRDTVKTICFVEGHGEKSLTSSESEGYSAVAGELAKENYQTKSVNLVSANDVPADCTVLVEAGPTQALFPQEVAMIGKYLDGGGKALVLDDPDTNPKLDDVLSAWNIKAGENTVIDASGVGRMFGTGPAVPLVVDYGTHAITRNFERTMTFFPLARTVSISDSAKSDPAAVELLKTSPASFAATNIKNGKVSFDPAKDTRGPLSLGVAADRKAGGKDARLVVIGDSDFAANRWVSLQRNGDLFFNTVNWLAQDEDLISVRPKSPTNRRVTLSEAQQKGLFWFSMALLPGLVIVSGVIIWWKRR